MNRLILFVLLSAILLYVLQKRKIDKYFKTVTDHFNYARPWSKEEKKKINSIAMDLYRKDRDTQTLTGRWKFPGMACADAVARRHGLSEVQRDMLAAYKPSEIPSRAKALFGITVDRC